MKVKDLFKSTNKDDIISAYFILFDDLNIQYSDMEKILKAKKILTKRII